MPRAAFTSSALTRRDAGTWLLGLAATALLTGAAPPPGTLGAAEPFSWEKLVELARRTAKKPYVQPPVSPLAAKDFDTLARLTYGTAGSIEQVIRLFPTATAVAPYAVQVNVVEKGMARPVVDTSGLFVDGAKADPAGFRIMAEDGHADWLSFMGASYFRTSGSRDQFGLSARGIAIDTGLPSGEEFPNFTRFWIEHVETDHFMIHALLDGPSLSGAFAIDTRGGDGAGAVQDVKAVLFMRRDVKQLGIAPASSMFWYDQASRAFNRSERGPDWRPEVHDSDGLAIWMHDGERIWRPLENALTATTFAFTANDPKGFGLLQRDQNFDHYQDDGSFYDRRPSLWVEPTGAWGEGAVKLYEMPTDNENQDNIAAFWTPARPVRAGQRLDFGYRLTWNSKDPTQDRGARCVNSWVGKAGVADAPAVAGAHKYVFDFAGPSLEGLERGSGVSVETNLPAGVLLSSNVYPVVRSPGLWRVALDIKAAGRGPMDFRLYLKRGDAALSETVIKALNV